MAVLAVVVLTTFTFDATPAGADPSKGSTGRTSGPSAPPATSRRAPSAANSAANSATNSSVSRTRRPATGKVSSSGIGSGAKGAAVSDLQTLLQQARYDVPEVTGTYGDQTFHAVMAFQKANGLGRTGRAGAQTLDALRSGAQPAPIMPNGGPDRIEVSLPKQYLALYRGGSLVKILSVSSGTGKDFCTLDPETGESGCDKAITPAGSFRVARRVIGWRESKLGLLYNPLYFAGGIAVHGAPSVPGSPASHGCVRIPMVSADYFPTVAPDGIPVYVSDGTTPLRFISSRISPVDAWVPPITDPTASTLPGTPGPSIAPGASTTVAALGPTTTLPATPTLARPLSSSTTSPAASTSVVNPAQTSSTTTALAVPTTTTVAPTTTSAPLSIATTATTTIPRSS